MDHVRNVQASAADRAGVQQGDQLLVVDGTTLGSRSPFEASSLLQVRTCNLIIMAWGTGGGYWGDICRELIEL